MKNNKGKKIGLMVFVICFCIFTSVAKAMTTSPYASSTANIAQINVIAWFSPGYKTTKSDAKYGVVSGKYIKNKDNRGNHTKGKG